MKTAQEKQGYIATILILCFTAGAMLAHAWYQTKRNAVAVVEAELDAYKKSAIVGYVKMDAHTKQLYFVANVLNNLPGNQLPEKIGRFNPVRLIFLLAVFR